MSVSVSSTDFINDLNEIQRRAATTIQGPVLVVAGPGSGKTRVLTYRIAWMLSQGIAPAEILALTFTNKAAREMKDRIERVVGAAAHQVWAGTFHSLFARILRIEAPHIGYPTNFTIYDTDDTKSLLSAIIKEMQLNKEQYNVNVVRSRISHAKSKLITPKRYAALPSLLEEDKMAKRPQFAEVYRTYMARCKQAGAMDFDDLLLRMYELLQSYPSVCQKYRQRFRYILVDEFQDTNELQYAIIRKLVHYEGSQRNVCVVGDDAQSIYAFRGATIQNILDFQKDFKAHGVKVFKLEQNYRSTGHIVEAANELIAYNKRQIPKTIRSEKGEGERIKVIQAMSESEEGRHVVNLIVEQKNRYHLRNSDFAILYRTNAQSRVFEEYLRHNNIPYRVFGGTSFYQRKEIKDVIAYLRLAINPKDEEALRRVINLPKRGIGQTTMEKVAAMAQAAGKPLWEVLDQVPVAARTAQVLSAFKNMVRGFVQKVQQIDAYEAALHILDQSGYIRMLQQDTTREGLGRQETVSSLLDSIQQFVDQDQEFEQEHTDKSLATWLQQVALMTDLDESSSTDDDYVTLMSVHSAKGLEFASVFVVGLEEHLFPSYLSRESAEGIDEERRLFYVAITRAERFLTLSYARSRYQYGKQRFNEPSRFLSEIDSRHLDLIGSAKSLVTPPVAKHLDSSPTASGGAKVQGAFYRRPRAQVLPDRVDPSTFKPSPPDQIQVGMRVLHIKFGEGKVLAIDGQRDKRMATIFFKDLPQVPQRRIMLKFAKLQILS